MCRLRLFLYCCLTERKPYANLVKTRQDTSQWKACKLKTWLYAVNKYKAVSCALLANKRITLIWRDERCYPGGIDPTKAQFSNAGIQKQRSSKVFTALIWKVYYGCRKSDLVNPKIRMVRYNLAMVVHQFRWSLVYCVLKWHTMAMLRNEAIVVNHSKLRCSVTAPLIGDPSMAPSASPLVTTPTSIA